MNLTDAIHKPDFDEELQNHSDQLSLIACFDDYNIIIIQYDMSIETFSVC